MFVAHIAQTFSFLTEFNKGHFYVLGLKSTKKSNFTPFSEHQRTSMKSSLTEQPIRFVLDEMNI